jgi:hypothetical protein
MVNFSLQMARNRASLNAVVENPTAFTGVPTNR